MVVEKVFFSNVASLPIVPFGVIGHSTFGRLKCRMTNISKFNPIRLSWVGSEPRHVFLSHYSKSVYPENTYIRTRESSGLNGVSPVTTWPEQ